MFCFVCIFRVLFFVISLSLVTLWAVLYRLLLTEAGGEGGGGLRTAVMACD